MPSQRPTFRQLVEDHDRVLSMTSTDVSLPAQLLLADNVETPGGAENLTSAETFHKKEKCFFKFGFQSVPSDLIGLL